MSNLYSVHDLPTCSKLINNHIMKHHTPAILNLFTIFEIILMVMEFATNARNGFRSDTCKSSILLKISQH